MTWMPSDIPEMERQLSEAGKTVAEMCRRAEIAETTWGRWKRQEFEPTMRLWRAATTAFNELTATEDRNTAPQDAA
ncbi:MAG: transposase [Proteobacteria bacterium]|nr:transposase [Pseudomonadota bacterium]